MKGTKETLLLGTKEWLWTGHDLPFVEGKVERDSLFAKKKMKLATPMGIRQKGKPLWLLVRLGEKEIKLEGIKCRRAEGCRVQKDFSFSPEQR